MPYQQYQGHNVYPGVPIILPSRLWWAPPSVRAFIRYSLFPPFPQQPPRTKQQAPGVGVNPAYNRLSGSAPVPAGNLDTWQYQGLYAPSVQQAVYGMDG